MANELEGLELWYLSQCDADWEHSYGVSIETSTVRAGWKLTVQLTHTGLKDAQQPTPQWPSLVYASSKTLENQIQRCSNIAAEHAQRRDPLADPPSIAAVTLNAPRFSTL